MRNIDTAFLFVCSCSIKPWATCGVYLIKFQQAGSEIREGHRTTYKN